MAITIKCPHCSSVMEIVPSVGIEKKPFDCPKCKEKMTVGEYLPKLSFKVGAQNYQLRFGKQWVGRNAPTSESDVQIPDDTRYMSKKHAVVEVACTAKGMAVTFEEHGKNPTEMQGVTLENDDIVYVNVNDCLQMGSVRLYLAPEFGE